MRHKLLVVGCVLLLLLTTPSSTAAATARVKPRTSWSPACMAFERWSAEWIGMGCFWGEPDPLPGSNEGG